MHRFLIPAFLLPALALANTKGLNQIVTPDIQPTQLLSVSFQAEHQALGNYYQAQYEYGFTKNFEAAVYQGLKPGSFQLDAELGLYAKGPWLVSTGFLNWGTQGSSTKPQSFLEGGFYKGQWRLTAGAQRVSDRTLGLAGAAYQATPQLTLAADYLSGRDNYATIGFTVQTKDGSLSLNPALYYANDDSKRLYPYAVLSYNVQLGK
ncbi:MAG: hypothetical protein JSS72_12050 [Armatimonadetes bacterium]|nr:hypothetical protein [Armatimonadota bacterium]